MLALVGTVPDPDFPLVAGQSALKGGQISLKGRLVPVNRGTAALAAAAIRAGQVLDLPLPVAFLVGDVGLGEGSRRLYDYLGSNLSRDDYQTLVFHYLQPDVDGLGKVLLAVEAMARRPVLIADAGFMYAAKMSGRADQFDLFTPDAGELAFLADEEAPHPFYTRGFILHQEDQVPDLIARAHEHGNAARHLLVKGQKDYVADQEGVLATVSDPLEEAMEAIGGTGDTLTGMAAALVESGQSVGQAALIAARANRLAGQLARLSPASQVMDIIDHIPQALEQVLNDISREGS